MRPLTAPELLRLWDDSAGLSPVRRALSLLICASPGEEADELAALPIGARDDRLLQLREWAFGPHLGSVAGCPACGVCVELTFQIDDIRAGPADQRSTITVQSEDCEIEVRLPNSLDLDALPASRDEYEGAQLLLRRCLLSARRKEDAGPAGELSDQTVREIERALSDADPQADVQLALSCPGCAEEWLAPFDIGSFFWMEIEAWAHRLLHDVHQLASAYGWRESDVLALPPRRRQLYLDLVRA